MVMKQQVKVQRRPVQGLATHAEHRGKHLVRVGRFEVFAGGAEYFREGDLEDFDVLVPLARNSVPYQLGASYQIVAACLPDFGGVPPSWGEFLESEIIPLLERRKKLLAYCYASHGRTGTFLASLIALLESEEETPDPILAVRERHCEHAVETLAQAEGIYALRGKPLPEQYGAVFSRR